MAARSRPIDLQSRKVAKVMLLAFLIALIIITVIATFPTFWIRLLTERAARSRKPSGPDTHGHSDL